MRPTTHHLQCRSAHQPCSACPGGVHRAKYLELPCSWLTYQVGRMYCTGFQILWHNMQLNDRMQSSSASWPPQSNWGCSHQTCCASQALCRSVRPSLPLHVETSVVGVCSGGWLHDGMASTSFMCNQCLLMFLLRGLWMLISPPA